MRGTGGVSGKVEVFNETRHCVDTDEDEVNSSSDTSASDSNESNTSTTSETSEEESAISFHEEDSLGVKDFVQTVN